MTTLLLHVSQYRKSAKQQQQQQQQQPQQSRGGSRRPYNFSTSVGRIRQPGLAAFAHYFVFSRAALSRYTPALAADLPSRAAMSAADTQAAPAFCLRQQQQQQQQRKTKPKSYFSCQKQQKTQQQLQRRLGSVSRSYSDPDLKCKDSSSLKSPPDVELSKSASADFKLDADNSDNGFGFERRSALNFRHSFDCLLDLLNGDGEEDGEPEPPAPVAIAHDASSADVQLHKAVPDSDEAGGMMKKRVKFADDVGKPLQHVRVFSEPSCAPPKFLSIRPLPADPDAADDDARSGDKACRFRCQFSQPSSKYILFRENVEKNCVSLSNFYFDELTAKGSVSVKNISFRKRVFIRVTFDEWASYRDVEATYASSQDARQDCFVFSLPCPADLERDFEFCVCFEADGQAFWDSNSGANYKVTLAKKAASSTKSRMPTDAYTSDFKPNYAAVTDFSGFSVWDHFADRVYY